MVPFLQDNVVFRGIYCWLGGSEGNAQWCGGRNGLLPGYDLGTTGYEWVAFFVAGFTFMFILINGALLGGHVRVHDHAIISGNAAVHHFATLGTMCFVSAASKVHADVPPYMLYEGCDIREVRTINYVGLQRNGILDNS